VIPVEVEDVVYEAVDGLGPASAGVVVDVAPALPAAMADAGLLERALANVVSNALAWSPPGIAVRVEAAAPGDDVVIRVVDQGPGIPKDGRDRLFQPFQRLGDGNGASPNGVGLGLAVASGFTAAMGGELTVEDTPGGGATFVFRLERAGHD
jgi:two-component system, OmpR family, sensor histidine kinase KdpD